MLVICVLCAGAHLYEEFAIYRSLIVALPALSKYPEYDIVPPYFGIAKAPRVGALLVLLSLLIAVMIAALGNLYLPVCNAEDKPVHFIDPQAPPSRVVVF